MKYFIAIPTYNGGGLWHQTIKNITQYSPADVFVHVIDSSSKDDTASLASEAGFDVLTIAGDDFNHGGTRNLAVKEYIDDYDVVIFLTQDAIPESGFIEEIISVFEDEDVASAYGRQLPHLNANPIARHARNFNYPTKGYVADKTSIAKMGLKTVFMSNSFSAYRLSVFKKLGGFPSDTILCEDMFYTAKAVMAGYKNVYAANAKVRHSHNYTPIEEFKRYFDIGVFHKDQPWIRDNFGGAGGEGTKFIISELKFLIANGISWLPLAMINNFMKIVGYKLGQNYKKLPKVIIKKCSMHKRFWKF
ncbi:glycosyltransferase family 2 protein [Klebsiella aerogenes]|uniref:Glycosyl transferase family 2 n=1 Tax=Klebsiella aerogenes TaxID=548 RepID=A0A346NT38_KLEAE|nr:glycosyltransferase [Klebsiella aerogenes]AXR70431.1 glycosyl transferase family 2 [Klebsiella aerogenes]EIV6182417.1 glycosyltransferase family 2 protein [Klebsiella aerogenes]EKW3882705.1 glycosyltransferase family 2 protein [Klebsiella aerogenes]ELD8624991.1 glycosyltransferase family 2 protein [Klebsiella aerogenes]KTI24010.1 rhamnosyltransferase [Klebsiella aerogenes]